MKERSCDCSHGYRVKITETLDKISADPVPASNNNDADVRLDVWVAERHKLMRSILPTPLHPFIFCLLTPTFSNG